MHQSLRAEKACNLGMLQYTEFMISSMTARCMHQTHKISASYVPFTTALSRWKGFFFSASTFLWMVRQLLNTYSIRGLIKNKKNSSSLPHDHRSIFVVFFEWGSSQMPDCELPLLLNSCAFL